MTESVFLDEEDTVPDDSDTSLDLVFNYEKLVQDRSKMHKLNGYYIGASNNFVRVFTLNGRKYWISQALCNHRAPDYKVHFSVVPQDVPRAFNLISKHFYQRKLKFGMKAIMIDKETESKSMSDESFKWNTHTGNDKSFTLEWPQSMRGREITLYIYRYYEIEKLKNIREYLCVGGDHDGALNLENVTTDNTMETCQQQQDTLKNEITVKDYSIYDETNVKYHYSNFMEFTSHPFKQFELTKQDEESLSFLRKWVFEVEQILERENIQSNGCADGDLSLGLKYASFRNESFIPVIDAQTHSADKHALSSNEVNELFRYPPNYSGWNAANYEEATTIAENFKNSTMNTFNAMLCDYAPLILFFLIPITIGVIMKHGM
ncbi:hypothetical protein C9374_001565 [Naegleria lovaniensis]|uniref:Uncharacterized protein n=1 Tax=Naegleria lovaniensis TaxID=51637 RepID=A0AA88KM30_NAELO|nr:uncharacterized protein C9374_001565 [Naegleria lovaniensis]KAG2387233.1 hypothetical protein C9374_001565 [Naegleria lovaniensis]